MCRRFLFRQTTHASVLIRNANCVGASVGPTSVRSFLVTSFVVLQLFIIVLVGLKTILGARANFNCWGSSTWTVQIKVVNNVRDVCDALAATWAIWASSCFCTFCSFISIVHDSCLLLWSSLLESLCWRGCSSGGGRILRSLNDQILLFGLFDLDNMVLLILTNCTCSWCLMLLWSLVVVGPMSRWSWRVAILNAMTILFLLFVNPRIDQRLFLIN